MFMEDAQLIMPAYGVKGVEGLQLDFFAFKKARDAYITRLHAIYHKNMAASGVEYVQGHGAFVDDKIVEVEETKQLFTADHILIASGGKADNGNFEGSEHCWNSDDIFAMEELPKDITVIGGGYVGLEIAQILNSFGVKVTVVIRSSPLKFVDHEIVNVLLDEMTKSGVDVRLKAPHKKVEKLNDGKLKLHLEDGSGIVSEKILTAIGRPPNTTGLGLAKTGVKIADRSKLIVTDEYQNTSRKGVYAVGDVIENGVSLTPVAVRAGRILSERLFNNRPTLKMNYQNVATVVFTHPTIGKVGFTENEAFKEFGTDNVKVYRSQFTHMFYGLIPPPQPGSGIHRPSSMYKLICKKEQGVEKVVGVHGIGRGIDEMM